MAASLATWKTTDIRSTQGGCCFLLPRSVRSVLSMWAWIPSSPCSTLEEECFCFSRGWSTCSPCALCTETWRPETSWWPASHWWKLEILGLPRSFRATRNTTGSHSPERVPSSGMTRYTLFRKFMYFGKNLHQISEILSLIFHHRLLVAACV